MGLCQAPNRLLNNQFKKSINSVAEMCQRVHDLASCINSGLQGLQQLGGCRDVSCAPAMRRRSFGLYQLVLGRPIMPLLCCAVCRLWPERRAEDWFETVNSLHPEWHHEGYQEAVAMVPAAPEYLCMWESLPRRMRYKWSEPGARDAALLKQL